MGGAPCTALQKAVDDGEVVWLRPVMGRRSDGGSSLQSCPACEPGQVGAAVVAEGHAYRSKEIEAWQQQQRLAGDGIVGSQAKNSQFSSAAGAMGSNSSGGADWVSIELMSTTAHNSCLEPELGAS